MIGYGSLGDAKQYVSAYVSGTAPDVRRYPVSITVTTGIQVDVDYPAEAWMTAEDVADYFNETLKPDLEESLQDLIDDHNEDPDAHGGALENKQDKIEVEGILKGTKTTTEEGDTYSVGAATPGTDYQAPTNTLTAAQAMTTQDLIPFYDVHRQPAQADHPAGAERGHRGAKPGHQRDHLRGGLRDLFGRRNHPGGHGFHGL